MGRAEDTCRLRHKMNTTEDNVLRLGLGGGLLGQQIGVALEVGIFDDLLPLIMVTQDYHPLAKFLTGMM